MNPSRALWLEAVGLASLRDRDLLPPGPHEVEVRSLFGAISRGSERLVLDGRVPATEHERMRAPFQEGNFPFPVKYGYATVGTIRAGPAERIGAAVFCLYPHQDRFVLPASAAYDLPDGVPPGRAVLGANMETALNIVWDAGVSPGDRVAVVGGGVVGALAAYLCGAIAATQTVLIDIDPSRKALADALDIAFAAPSQGPADCDVCIHASGSQAGLATAIDCAGLEARIVEASWYGEGSTGVALGGAFHSRRLAIVGSQVGRVPAARGARWTSARRMKTALALLADDRLDVLISGESAFSELAGDYAAILADPATLCHRIRY